MTLFTILALAVVAIALFLVKTGIDLLIETREVDHKEIMGAIAELKRLIQKL